MKRDIIQGEPLTNAERKALMETCQKHKTKRQINLGIEFLSYIVIVCDILINLACACFSLAGVFFFTSECCIVYSALRCRNDVCLLVSKC